ncbi:MAG: SusE domain-containing protein [Sediminibacterium sp.]
MRNFLPVQKTVLVILASLVFLSCRKSVNEPTASLQVQAEVKSFRVSESRVVLLQGNESNLALSFSWKQQSGINAKYTIEAVVCGTSFEEHIDLVSTNEDGVSVTVKELNSKICQLIYANNTARIALRVRTDGPAHVQQNPVYSEPVAVELTTYRNYTEYADENVFKIPGNYQGWDLSTAPKIVATDTPEEYEGYINFSNDYPQLLLVKGSKWEPIATYSYIGSDKFGFGGSVLSVFGGAGVYLFRANFDTRRWSCTKINNWGIVGTAVPANSAEPVMNPAKNSQSWSITTNLVKGNFRIRANNNNAISFGQKTTDEPGVPSYAGNDIVIKQAGTYTIKLELQVSGNYAYSILKNS